MSEMLKVGDTVMWRGGFGTEPAKPAKVTSINVCQEKRGKYGRVVSQAPWVDKDYLCVGLNTGNWAYGSQISPM